jgi:lipopolysaccharide transport system permease protein
MIKTKRQNGNYEIVIQPTRGWLLINWRDLIHYRDLLFLLVRRDFVSKYKQTILGPLWFILQPLIMTIVFEIVFNRIAKVSTDNLPPFLFYLCGVMIWNYFANCVQSSSNSLISNAELFRKVYFPRIVMPLSGVISNLFAFAIQLVTFLVFYIYFKYFTSAGTTIDPKPLLMLMLPLLLFQAAIFSLGIGLWVSSLTAKYRDLAFVMTFLVQLWMYATPVVYPVSAIPAKWRFIMAINPMCAVVDLYRYAFFGTIALSYKYLAISIVTTIVTLLTGLFIFNRVEKNFVDTI